MTVGRIEALPSVMLKAVRRLLDRGETIKAIALLDETITQLEAIEQHEREGRHAETHEIRDATWGIYG